MMDQPQNFGQFLLFQKTDSNPYRSCYRAGLARGRAIERIIRLEVFDQSEIDADQLMSSLDSSTGLQEKLKDPHIAAGAGIGHIDGVPYTAYDFELGTTLSAFLDAARRRSFPVPFDQALFIAERIALALAAAYQVDHNDGHVLHSFLTPDSVLLSNEGAVKVAGFEVGHALRLQLAARPFCAPYMSPKCRAGQSRLDQDDVFSLGSILFELVTGEPLSVESVDLDGLIVQATGEPAPESLKLLLERSFAPAASRIPHVMAWQQSLGKLILDGEYNPTTFNLAFLLHTLLRDELERGLEDLTQEKRFVLPQPGDSELTGEVTSETSAAPVPVLIDLEIPGREASVSDHGPQSDSGIELSSSVSTSRSYSAAAGAADRKPFWLGFSISVATAGAILGAFLLFGSSSEEAPASPLAAPANAATRLPQLEGPPAPTPPPMPTGAEPEAVPTQQAPVMLSEVVNGEVGQPLDEDEISRVVAERADEIQRNLKAEYERKLESLRTEIKERSQRELAAEREAALVEPPPEPEVRREEATVGGTASLETETVRAAPAVAVATPSSVPSASEPKTAAPAQEPEPQTLLAAPTRDAPGAAEIEVEPQEPAAPPIAIAQPAPDRELPSGIEPSTGPANRPRTPTRQPEPIQKPRAEIEPSARPAKAVRSPAKLIRLNPPTYPAAARRLGRSATARIKVLISSEGKVTQAEIVGPALGSGFDGAALAAVRRSRWEPATNNGDPIESWTSVTIEFKP